MPDAIPIDVDVAKRTMRAAMREVRRSLPDQAERSERIWARVQSHDAVAVAGTVMAFTSVDGEPQTAPFIAWCGTEGKRVLLPEDDPPPDPATVDVVVVPGTAFTVHGDRLGQGGGWYDRFLPEIRESCVTIGVCFEPQLVESIPTDVHDCCMDTVITDRVIGGAD